jgi:hypothetical protein
MLDGRLRSEHNALVTVIVVVVAATTARAADGGFVDAGANDAGLADAGASVPGWTCDNSLYDDNTCDCACGVIDPDCGIFPDVSDCQRWDCPDGIVDGTDITQCRTFNAPDAWTCQGFLYDSGGTCDCGCGVVDADCTPPNTVAQCGANWCDPGFHVTDADLGVCVRLAPPEWTCAASRFVDDVCDCGCGAYDPECPNATISACEREHCEEPAYVDAESIGLCRSEGLPLAWSCAIQNFGDLICDCGCGATDPDCPVPADEHDCVGIACDSQVVEDDDPTLCATLPAGWECSPLAYNAEDRCNCECGAWDPDCADEAVTSTTCIEGFRCEQPGECVVYVPEPDAGVPSVDAGDPTDDPPGCFSSSVVGATDTPPSFLLALGVVTCWRMRRRAARGARL